MEWNKYAIGVAFICWLMLAAFNIINEYGED